VVKTLYHGSYDSILLRCLSNSEAQEVLKEAHDGIYEAHQSGLKLKDRLHRFDYDWPTMIANAIKYVRRCKACQIHTDFILQPSKLLHPIVSSWPFEAWGIDVVESISLSSAKGHQFILAIIDYFSKWVKVHHSLKLKSPMWSTSSNTMSSIDWCPQTDHPRQWSLICKTIILSIL